MLNERGHLEETIIQILRERGCPIVKDDVRVRKSNKVFRPDLVGQTVGEDGALHPQVVVEIKSRPTPDAQQQVMEYARVLKAPFGLLVLGEDQYWFDAETGLPVAAPYFTSRSFITAQEDITKVFWECSNGLRGYLSDNEVVGIIICGLVVRAYLQKQGRLEVWDSIQEDHEFVNLTKEAQLFFNIRIDESMLRNVASVVSQVVAYLNPLPPISPDLGEAVTKLLGEVGRKEVLGEYVTPETVRNLLKEIIRALSITGSQALDLSAGYGSLTHAIHGIVQVERFMGVEIVNQVAMTAQVISAISGYDNVHIICDDSLHGHSEVFEQYNSNSLVLVDGPFGRYSGREDLKGYAVTLDGKRTRVDLVELFIEKAIRLTKPGGHVVAVVPEGILFGGPSQITRDYIKEHTIIEAIVSLPSHAFRPYTGIKTSVLVMRKKSNSTETAEELFLGNPESLDDFGEVVQAFSKWRNGGDQS